MQKYIVFDVETTGLPKDYKASPKLFELWPHIVQFSWIVVNKNTIERSYIIKPDNYIIIPALYSLNQSLGNSNTLWWAKVYSNLLQN